MPCPTNCPVSLLHHRLTALSRSLGIIITTRNSIFFQPAIKRLPRTKHPSDLGPKLQSPRTLHVIFAYIKLWSSKFFYPHRNLGAMFVCVTRS